MPKSGGKTIRVSHNGQTSSQNFRFIDFDTPSNNEFSVVVEYRASGKSGIRVDIVIFVNGIPLAMIENKRSSESVSKGIQQHLRNQKSDYCPRLFVYPQILVSTNKEEFLYGTMGTPEEFWATWREKDADNLDERVADLIAQPIDEQVYATILSDHNGSTSGHAQDTKRTPTPQDKNVAAFFAPERLLDLAKNFIVYDAGIKKIMRYQQYFAIKKVINRVQNITTTKHGEKRE